MLSFGEASREMFFIHQLGTNSVHTQSPCFPELPSPELRFPQQRKKKKSKVQSEQDDRSVIFDSEERQAKH